MDWTQAVSSYFKIDEYGAMAEVALYPLKFRYGSTAATHSPISPALSTNS